MNYINDKIGHRLDRLIFSLILAESWQIFHEFFFVGWKHIEWIICGKLMEEKNHRMKKELLNNLMHKLIARGITPLLKIFLSHYYLGICSTAFFNCFINGKTWKLYKDRAWLLFSNPRALQQVLYQMLRQPLPGLNDLWSPDHAVWLYCTWAESIWSKVSVLVYK